MNTTHTLSSASPLLAEAPEAARALRSASRAPVNDFPISTPATTPDAAVSPPPAGAAQPGHTQTAVGLGLMLLAGLLGWGASSIPTEAGYAGVSAAFLPWLVSGVLGLCGVLVAWMSVVQRRQTHAAVLDEVYAVRGRPDWGAMAWVSAGLLANAALIQSLGFVLSCALLFALAARGVRQSMGQDAPWTQLGRDLIAGVLLSAPVFALFTRALGLTLPSLLANGWI